MTPPQPVCFDLCCDHGLIGFWMAEKKKAQKIVFVDQVPHITFALEKRCEQFANFPFEVHTLDAREVNITAACNVIIAGVYTSTVLDIATNIAKGAQTSFQLICCPHSDDALLRENLEERGYHFDTKEAVSEKGKTFYIYRFRFEVNS